jgi:hypothetical protein
MVVLRAAAFLVALLIGSGFAVAQPQTARKKRALPPLQQKAPEVRQGGLSDNPPPQATKVVGNGTGWQSFDFNPAGEYAGEYPEPESYTPEPLCDPPDVVFPTGLGSTLSVPTAGDPYWK